MTGAAIWLWLIFDLEQVVILVWDASPQPPVPADPSEDAENGRGLLLVQALSQQWECTSPSIPAMHPPETTAARWSGPSWPR